MHWRLFRDNAALDAGGLALMALDDVYARDQHAAVIGIDLQHFAGFALVAARGDNHAITFFHLRRHHNTSGAKEMIFMWFLARNSRVTGPKMRVPIGSF